MAGLITAASVAHYSNQRARVLVVDRNPAAEPGKKTRNGWTCGDAVSRNSLNYLASNLGIQYGRPEVEHDVKGIYVYSPDHKTKVLFEGEGHLLNRKLAPRRQVRMPGSWGLSSCGAQQRSAFSPKTDPSRGSRGGIARATRSRR